MRLRSWTLAVLCWHCSDIVLSSPFDPHPLPASTALPYYNGWLVRLVDHSRNLSATCIWGGFKPAEFDNFNTTWVALLFHSPSTDGLLAEQHFVDHQKGIRVEPRSQPTAGTISSFVWQSPERGTFDVHDDVADLDFQFEGLRLQMKLSQRTPWHADEPNTAGPEGWSAKALPLLLHHYVHSLASKVSYNVSFDGGELISGAGHAHMETNYGQVFPRAWLWSQAISELGDSQLLFAAGRYVSGPLSTDMLIVAYRSAELQWNFRSMDRAKITRVFNATAGYVQVVAVHEVDGRELRVNVSGDPKGFSRPFYYPSSTGLTNRPGSIESHSSTATVAAYVHGSLMESRVMPFAALEFGGDFKEVAEVPELEA